MARATIRKDTHPDPRFCWYYSVDADNGAPIDYGSMETQQEALGAVAYALTHRALFDNAAEA